MDSSLRGKANHMPMLQYSVLASPKKAEGEAMTLIPALSQSVQSLRCSACKAEVYNCDGCDSYFEDEGKIFCSGACDHYCVTCKPEEKQ